MSYSIMKLGFDFAFYGRGVGVGVRAGLVQQPRQRTSWGSRFVQGLVSLVTPCMGMGTAGLCVACVFSTHATPPAI